MPNSLAEVLVLWSPSSLECAILRAVTVIAFSHKMAYFRSKWFVCVQYCCSLNFLCKILSFILYILEIHVHVAGVATLLLATPLSAKNTLLAAMPPYECNSGDSSVRRVSMIFTSASNPILYKGVSVNQAGYASLTQANLGGRTISNARTLINNA